MILELEARLERERPVPSASFRGELRRRLVAPSRSQIERGRARILALAYGSCGAALLLVGLLGVSGVGPLSPS
jgi:hypothetical protein